MIVLLLVCLIVAQCGNYLAYRKWDVRPGWKRALVSGLVSGGLSFIVAVGLFFITAPASLLTLATTIVVTLLISYFYAARGIRPKDENTPARWRLLNPVIIGTAAVVAAILLYWARLLIISDKPVMANDAAELFAWIIQSYFHPQSMLGNTPAGLAPKPPAPGWQWMPWAVWAAWLLFFLISAQPFKPKLRVAGSILGLLAVLLWTGIVIGAFIGAGLRH